MIQLICLSISHHNAPVELRESLNLTQEAIDEILGHFSTRKEQYEAIHELAILSTCNRLELYAVLSVTENEDFHPTHQLLWAYLDDRFTLPHRLIDLYSRKYTGVQAVEHLFLVAAGLDSIAIGETQVLGQVSRSLDTALRQGSAGHVLPTFFRAAIHTGKRVHSETEIGRHPTSLSSIAIQVAEDNIGALNDLSILVVGAGKMGQHALKALKERGARRIVLTNRTRQHADELANDSGEKVVPFEQLGDALAGANLVFTSVISPQPIISKRLVMEMMSQRPHRPLAIIDLAVPRNVEPGVRLIEGVKLYDMDDLQAYVAEATESDLPEIASAREIVAGEVAEYEKLLRIIPFIGELHKKIELIRQREVERSLRLLHSTDPQVTEQIELLSHALVRKILHEPTMHLRSETDQETLNDYVDALSRLFDLTENEASPSF